MSGEPARDSPPSQRQATATGERSPSTQPGPADTASVFARTVAHFVDLGVVLVLGLGGFFLGTQIDSLIWTTAPDAEALRRVGYMLNAQLTVLGILAGVWHTFLAEGAWEGQTVGKRLLGIRVVTESGDPPGYGASALRNLLGVVDAMFLWALGCALMAANDMDQRFGDRVANTVVVPAE